MNDFLKNNFEKLRRTALGELFDALENVLVSLDLDFCLIGARARDVWLQQVKRDRARTTLDVDFAVFVYSGQHFDQLRRALEEAGFEPDPRESYRFRYRGQIVDILPFTENTHNDQELFQHLGLAISVHGMREAGAEAEPVGGKFQVVSLPGLCVLKLIAFYERSDRTKDKDDFFFIIRNYFEIGGDLLFHGECDDLITDDFDVRFVSARMLGRQIANLILYDTELLTVVKQSIARCIDNLSANDITAMYQANKGDRQHIDFMLAIHVLQGIADTSK